MDSNLPVNVQMQYLRPAELEERGRAFPVVYVPFGLIEWHGPHLPLGNDAMKAHAILCKCAERHGGVVYPPVWFHSCFPREHLEPVLAHLFERLKKTGYRVIIAISGHNVNEQIDMAARALEPVTADGTVRGYAGWEISLSRSKDSDTDHAAKWETSNMQFFYPGLVDMEALGEGPINLDMKPPCGMIGLDPRTHANADVGRLNCMLAADAIGCKARELYLSLPEEHRGFNIERINPQFWWYV